MQRLHQLRTGITVNSGKALCQRVYYQTFWLLQEIVGVYDTAFNSAEELMYRRVERPLYENYGATQAAGLLLSVEVSPKNLASTSEHAVINFIVREWKAHVPSTILSIPLNLHMYLRHPSFSSSIALCPYKFQYSPDDPETDDCDHDSYYAHGSEDSYSNSACSVDY